MVVTTLIEKFRPYINLIVEDEGKEEEEREKEEEKEEEEEDMGER